MNNNISRITLACAGSVALTLGSVSMAVAQESSPSSEKGTTPPVTQTATISGSPETTSESIAPEPTDEDNDSVAPEPDNETTAAAEKNIKQEAKNNSDPQKDGKLPDYSIQSVTLDILDNSGKEAKKDASVEEIKKTPAESFTVRGNYKMKIPGDAKKGDKITIKFFNGKGGKNWKDNTRQIKVNGEPYLDITSEDGQTYTVELLKEACGLEASFSLTSNLNGTSGESQKFDYTKETKAPDDVDWEGKKCSSGSEKPSKDKDKDDKSDSSSSTSTTTSKKPSGEDISSGLKDISKILSMNSGAGDNSDAPAGDTAPGEEGGAPASDHDSQTVVSGGGFTDDSKAHNPKWNKSDGGESISVSDNPNGPEVNTGGEIQSQSFFDKIVGLFS